MQSEGVAFYIQLAATAHDIALQEPDRSDLVFRRVLNAPPGSPLPEDPLHGLNDVVARPKRFES
jgi:hypothetical protein